MNTVCILFSIQFSLKMSFYKCLCKTNLHKHKEDISLAWLLGLPQLNICSPDVNPCTESFPSQTIVTSERLFNGFDAVQMRTG